MGHGAESIADQVILHVFLSELKCKAVLTLMPLSILVTIVSGAVLLCYRSIIEYAS